MTFVKTISYMKYQFAFPLVSVGNYWTGMCVLIFLRKLIIFDSLRRNDVDN